WADRSGKRVEARFLFWSVVELQRELHDSRIAGQGSDLPKITSTGSVVCRQSELRCVQRVEDLPAKFQVTAFTHYWEDACQGHIKVGESGALYCVAPAVAQMTCDWSRKSSRTEVGASAVNPVHVNLRIAQAVGERVNHSAGTGTADRIIVPVSKDGERTS